MPPPTSSHAPSPDPFVAVTGDLVDSRARSRADRAALQRLVLGELEALDPETAGLVRPAALTAGDEVQALFARGADVVAFVQRLTDVLADPGALAQDVVFGVGRGPLSTGLLRAEDGVEHLDGPCFHHARAALERAKKERTWVVFEGFGVVGDPVLTGLFGLMGALRRGWTATQHAHTLDVRALGKRVDVARRRGVSPSVVTESLQAARYDEVVAGEAAARAYLAHVDEHGPDGAAEAVA